MAVDATSVRCFYSQPKYFSTRSVFCFAVYFSFYFQLMPRNLFINASFTLSNLSRVYDKHIEREDYNDVDKAPENQRARFDGG